MLKAKTFDIDFGGAEVVLNIEDANELELRTQDRVKLVGEKGSIIAIIHTTNTFVKQGEIGIFKRIMKELGVKNGEKVDLEPVEKPDSLDYIKKKLNGQKLSRNEIYSIINDAVSQRLSLIDLSAFVSALQANDMEMDEIVHLTKAMTEQGKNVKFPEATYDKHSLGGVPGDKTTLLVVPIVAAAGLTIPKTSSRAITDPAGTADRMEVFSPVSHDIKKIEQIVKKTGGCIVWGGAVDLAPADDALIQVEYPLSLDPRPLLLASVMSKKHAVNSKFVVIDIPLGEGSKVPTLEEARKLAHDFVTLGNHLNMYVECALTYGAQPVGDAMGPALEAREALKALEGEGPNSLLEKSTAIAGILLEAAGIAPRDKGEEIAMEYLKNGKALKKFREIIKAQGGKSDVTVKDIEKKIGKHKKVVTSQKSGYVTRIHNRKIASVAKSAGAPHDKGAGILLHAKGGDPIKKGEKLFTIYSEKKHKLETAVKMARRLNPVTVEGMLLEEIPESSFIGRR